MKKQKQARLALLFALVIFGTLGTIMVDSGKFRYENPEQENTRRQYQVQLDIRGDLLNDYVLVQDTLSHYMTEALPDEGNLSSIWEMNYCCDDPNLYAANEDPARVFQWWGEFDFENALSHEAFLKELLSSQQIQIENFDYQNGTIAGIASAQLQVPGHSEGVIEFQQVKFNLRTTLI